MRWFGQPGGAAYEKECEHAPVPIGQLCGWCDEAISAQDDGLLVPEFSSSGRREVPYHYECNLRQAIGGVNHLRGRCQCCGGSEPPDPGWLTRRQAAIQAVFIWQSGQL